MATINQTRNFFEELRN